MVDLNDPKYEFLRDDPVFLRDLYEDHVDPRLPWSFAGTPERNRLAGALRQLADVFTSRHDLPIPKDGYVRLDVIADGERRVAEIAHGPGGYHFQVLPDAFAQVASPPEAAKSAPMLAATDTPEAASPQAGQKKTTTSARTGRDSSLTPRRRGR